MSFNSKDFKGFTFRSGPAKKTSKSFSTFWDNSVDDYDVDEFLGLDTDVKKGKDLVALAGYRRAISNFVNIVTGMNIPVSFNNNDESFTDGKKVVIGSNLTDKNFDVAVGLALHEGSHIKLSDFNIIRHLETNIPAEIFVLVNLEVLDLGGNQISEIPAEIGALVNLQELYLRNNNNYFVIPPEIGALVTIY